MPYLELRYLAFFTVNELVLKHRNKMDEKRARLDQQVWTRIVKNGDSDCTEGSNLLVCRHQLVNIAQKDVFFVFVFLIGILF